VPRPPYNSGMPENQPVPTSDSGGPPFFFWIVLALALLIGVAVVAVITLVPVAPKRVIVHDIP